MGSSPTSSLPVSYYQSLLTSQYRSAAKLNAWLQALIKIADDVSQCMAGVAIAFDLDSAVGVQLDTLGQLIGASRVVPFQPSYGVSPILDDDTYRLLLKATVANNQWDGRIGSLYPIWAQLFPSGNIVIIDNQDMSALVLLTGSFSSIMQDLIANGLIVPRPQGVQYVYAFGALPYFGFDRNDAFVAGFDVGHLT